MRNANGTRPAADPAAGPGEPPRQTVYVDPTVVEYLTAQPSRDPMIAPDQEITRMWWRLTAPRYDLVAARHIVEEAGAGDRDSVRIRLKALEAVTLLDPTLDTSGLSARLLENGAIPPHAASGAVHLALAAIHATDLLVTWSEPLANALLYQRIEQTCREFGHTAPEVYTPPYLMGGDYPDCEALAELREVREAYQAEFNHDLGALFADLRQLGAEGCRERARKAVGLSPSS